MIQNFRRYLAHLKPGPVDAELVRRYLHLKRPEDLAIIAAPMAPRAEDFTPDQLVERSLALLAAAKSVFLHQQKQLLEEMNANTLLELNQVLNGAFDHDLTAYQDSERLYDPITFPLAHHLRQIRENMPEEVSRLENERIAKALAIIAQPKPSLPCTLEEAIRHVTDEKSNVPWEALERGFIDCLGIMMIDDAINRDAQPGLRVQTDFHVNSPPQAEQGVQADTTATAIDDAQTAPKTPNARSTREDRLAELRAVRAAFKPLWQAPSYVACRADEYYAELRNNGVTDESKLAWLVENFRDFWREHKLVYISHFKELKIQSSLIKKVKQNAGGAGTASREMSKWRGVTTAFCEHVRHLPKYPETIGELNLAFNEFKLGHGMPQKVSKDAAQRFIFSLWSAANTPDKSSQVLGKLIGKPGFRKLQMDFADECMKMLEALKDVPKT